MEEYDQFKRRNSSQSINLYLPFLQVNKYNVMNIRCPIGIHLSVKTFGEPDFHKTMYQLLLVIIKFCKIIQTNLILFPFSLSYSRRFVK